MGLKVVKRSSKAIKMPAKKATNKSVGKSKPGIGIMIQDTDYRAEDDARTLMQAEEIKRDSARLSKAKAIAKKKADDASKVAKL